jgi:DMSO/TMAO reductase YedYZ molybdopterin-dependent catalytic subunit
MAGNLAEWCRDNYFPNYSWDKEGHNSLYSSSTADDFVVRGGSGPPESFVLNNWVLSLNLPGIDEPIRLSYEALKAIPQRTENRRVVCVTGVSVELGQVFILKIYLNT